MYTGIKLNKISFIPKEKKIEKSFDFMLNISKELIAWSFLINICFFL
jgi:hypothetical protein